MSVLLRWKRVGGGGGESLVCWRDLDLERAALIMWSFAVLLSCMSWSPLATELTEPPTVNHGGWLVVGKTPGHAVPMTGLCLGEGLVLRWLKWFSPTPSQTMNLNIASCPQIEVLFAQSDCTLTIRDSKMRHTHSVQIFHFIEDVMFAFCPRERVVTQENLFCLGSLSSQAVLFSGYLCKPPICFFQLFL